MIRSCDKHASLPIIPLSCHRTITISAFPTVSNSAQASDFAKASSDASLDSSARQVIVTFPDLRHPSSSP
jgi:hypothetical protein